MANNYIEEFFIGIGFDTKRVKQEAKEVDKTLDGLVKKRQSGTRKETQYVKKSEEEKATAVKKAEVKKQAAIKKTKDLINRRVQGQAEGIRRGSAYHGLSGKGKLGDTDARMQQLVRDKDVRGLKDLSAELVRTNAATNKLMRSQIGLRTVQGGLTDSTRNMIRSYASVFALFQGTMAIKSVGQDFQSLRASMLVVSDDSVDAASKMAFVREKAYELGVDLKTAAKAYLALSASSADALGEDGVKGLFTSVMKISRAFGMSVDDTKGSFKAFTQINGLPTK